MTKPWKHKINSSNILLVLVTSILVEAEWASGTGRCCDHWKHRRTYVTEDNGREFIVGDDRISRYYFRSSTLTNPSLTLENLNRCLDNFQLVTCLKMLLLDHINVAVDVLRRQETAQTDFDILDGLVSFKRTQNAARNRHEQYNDHYNDVETSEISTLDEEIFKGIFKLFENRSLEINLAPNYRINVAPIPGSQKSGFVHFEFKVLKGKSDEDAKTSSQRWTGRNRKKKGGGMSMMMFIPQMIMLGFLPFTLASIKAMVMNAVMVNMMALNGAIFMTIRNLVFGPRAGSNVQYVNYGYSKDRQTQKKRPVLIIHSPAAFVKQPEPHYYKTKMNHHQSFHPNRNGMYHYYHGTHDKKFQLRDSGERWYDSYHPHRPRDVEYESNDVIGEANEEQIYHEEEEEEEEGGEENDEEIRANQVGSNGYWNVKNQNFYGNEIKELENGRETTLFVRPTRQPFLHHG